MNFGTISGPPGWTLYCCGPVGPEGFAHDDDATGWLLHEAAVSLTLPRVGGVPVASEFAALLDVRRQLRLEVDIGGAMQVGACLYDFDRLPLEVAGKPLPGGPMQVRLVPEGALPAGLRCTICLRARIERPLPRVLNRYIDLWEDYPGAVSIERPSKWGNRYVVGRGHPRGTCVALHRRDVLADTREAAEFRALVRRELRGRCLVCVCAPMPCHGDVLLAVANSEEPDVPRLRAAP